MIIFANLKKVHNIGTIDKVSLPNQQDKITANQNRCMVSLKNQSTMQGAYTIANRL